MHKKNGFNNKDNNNFNKDDWAKDGDNNFNKDDWVKYVSLFIMRITISMVGVITCKSLFWSWYNETYSWVEFCNNFYCLSSGLIAIGCFAGGLINKLLDFTPLNVNVNVNMFLYDSTLKRLKNLILSWKDLVLNQDRNPIIGQPGGSSSQGSRVGQSGGNSSSGGEVGPKSPVQKKYKFINYRPGSQVGPESQVEP